MRQVRVYTQAGHNTQDNKLRTHRSHATQDSQQKPQQSRHQPHTQIQNVIKPTKNIHDRKHDPDTHKQCTDTEHAARLIDNQTDKSRQAYRIHNTHRQNNGHSRSTTRLRRLGQ